MSLFRIKVCGITQPDDALLAARFGADAIGLNFYRPSPRSVKGSEARKIVDYLRAQLQPQDAVPKIVGVFVNHPISEIATLTADVGLDAIQLHGDERPDAVLALRNFGTSVAAVPIIRAIRVSKDLDAADSQSLIDEANAWATAGVSMILLDAAVPGEFGGNGTSTGIGGRSRIPNCRFRLFWQADLQLKTSIKR